MAWSRSKNKRLATVGLAVLIPSWSLRPRSRDEFLALLDAQGIQGPRRESLVRAWRTGGVVYFVADRGLHASRDGMLAPAYLEAGFAAAMFQDRLYLRELAQLLLDRKIDLSTFRQRAAEAIEQAHYDAALLLVGPLLYGMATLMNAVLEMIRAQLAYLDGLVADILAGRQALDGTLLRRLAMYGGSGWAALQGLGGVEALLNGMSEERNVLGAAEHCGGCLVETGRGWVPIGTLVPVGSRDCLSNCLCTLEFR